MTEKDNLINDSFKLTIKKDEVVSDNIIRKNLGFLVLSYYYHYLNIDDFWNKIQGTINFEFNLNHIFQALTFINILNTSSKGVYFKSLNEFFFDLDFQINDIYKAYDVFTLYSDDLIYFINESTIQIEENFKIKKTTLESKQLYLTKNDHINIHPSISFVSSLILKLLKKDLKKYGISIKKAIHEINEISATYINENYYMLDRYNEIVRILGEIIDVDFSKRFWSIEDIKEAKNFKKKDL